ncbi:MAG: hypothetical protein ACXW2C_00115 [Acidimicrobiia bacterium]|jgi:hypothetical protein
MEYLLLALGLIVGGVAIVMFRNRRPTGIDASIEEFEQSLEAIAPPPPDPQRGRRSG